MIKAVFFDLGDTLCDYRGAAEVAVDSACEYAASHADMLNAIGLREAYLRELRQAEEETRRWVASPPEQRGMAASYQPWERALEKCGVVNPILAHAVACHYELARMRALRLAPDALPVLQSLQGRVAVGVVGEGAPGVVNEELTRLDLRGLLSAVVIEGEVGYLKRDPQLFAHAVRQVDCEPAAVAHVGDSLQADIAPARQAGLVAVWLNREGLPPPEGAPVPDYTVGDLHPVPGLLLGEQ